MKQIILSLLWIAVFKSANAQTFEQIEAAGFRDIAVSPNGKIWACGQDGRIWYTTTNGQQWTHVRASGFAQVSANNDYLVACGYDGTIWIANTTDENLQQTTAQGFGDVSINENNQLCGVSKNGTIWTSSVDNFNTWTQVPAEGFLSIDNSISTTVSAGKNGTIWRSYDIGAIWEQTPATGFQQIAISPAGLIYAVGSNETIWKSMDKGDTWEKLGTTEVYSVDLNETIIAIVKIDGTIWVGQINTTPPYNKAIKQKITKKGVSVTYKNVNITLNGVFMGECESDKNCPHEPVAGYAEIYLMNKITGEKVYNRKASTIWMSERHELICDNFVMQKRREYDIGCSKSSAGWHEWEEEPIAQNIKKSLDFQVNAKEFYPKNYVIVVRFNFGAPHKEGRQEYYHWLTTGHLMERQIPLNYSSEIKTIGPYATPTNRCHQYWLQFKSFW